MFSGHIAEGTGRPSGVLNIWEECLKRMHHFYILMQKRTEDGKLYSFVYVWQHVGGPFKLLCS